MLCLHFYCCGRAILLTFATLVTFAKHSCGGVLPRTSLDVDTGGELLRREVEQLRSAGLEAPVLELTDVRLLRQAVDPQTLETRLVAPSSTAGPWTLDAVVQGRPGSNFDEQYRISMRVGPKYPQGPPPDLLVKGTLHHVSVDSKLDEIDSRVAKLIFHNATSNRYELAHALEKLPAIFEGPLKVEERQGWHRSARENAQRLDIIHKYKPLRRHPDMFGKFQDTWLEKKLSRALVKLRNTTISAGKRRGLVRKLMTEEADGIYSFQVFTPEFCTLFLEELTSFYASKLPARRPNSMNNYGVIVNEIGMEHMITSLQERVLQPLIAVLFPSEGSELDGHHSFIVRYKNGEDTHLDVHHDDSDVTFNVCLTQNFTGAGLVLCGRKDAADHRIHRHTYHHKLGRAILHLGRHRHGADDIISGERLNLIVWNKAHNWRKSKGDQKDPQMRESRQPDPECLSYTHDRDYGRFKKYPPGKSKHKGGGWCPPRGQEYPGDRKSVV